MIKQILRPEELETLEREASKAELQGRLTGAQLEILFRRGLFHLFVPKQYGGLELDLLEGKKLQEQLAYLDGSLGWTVTLCSGASWFVGFMDPTVMPRVFSDPRACFGGSGMVSGQAEMIDGGFRINGHWKYATGAPHNTIFTANCIVTKGGEEVLDMAGKPKLLSFYFLRDEVEIIEDWQTMGLIATGSHSFAVQDLWVDESRSFEIVPEKVRMDQPIYRYPFQAFAEVTLGANYLGMFRRFLDEADALGVNLVGVERWKLDDLADQFHQETERSWELFQSEVGELQTDECFSQVGEHARKLVQEGLQSMTKIYVQLGMRAADPSQPLNRLWRDIFTASQHMMFR